LAASLDDAFPSIRAVDTEWDGSLPSTLLMDGSGRLVLTQHGLTRFDALEAAIARLGTEPSPAPGIERPSEPAAELDLAKTIATIAGDARGRVGAAAMLVETGERALFHGDDRFPMQSVYKMPIAMAVLHAVDEGRLSLAQRAGVEKKELLPREAHSPIRDEHPEGVELSVAELLGYAVTESDGTASDVLLRLVGGTSRVQAYLTELGAAGLLVANTEREIAGARGVQYRNWATPVGIVDLLRAVQLGTGLSPASRILLLQLMTDTTIGARRLKGLLPPGTVVAHKTGTSATSAGVTAATNDVGIVTLPDGRHLALAVFVSDSPADLATRESVIARIARAAWDWSLSAGATTVP
jgi:beta-lactamase class A